MVSNDDLFVIGLGTIGVFVGIYFVYRKSKNTVQPNPGFPIQWNPPSISPILPNIPITPPTVIPSPTPASPISPTPLPPAPLPPTPIIPVPAKPLPKNFGFLLIGQSNCANWGETPMTSTKAKVYNNGTIFPTAADPLQGSDGSKGSVWTRLVDTIDTTKYQITLIPAAVGGTSISRWAPSAKDLFENVIKQVNGYKAKGGVITHVLWHQGESDIGMDTNLYKQKFIEMANALNALTNNAKIYVAQATYCNGQASDALRAAQVQLGQMFNAGPNTDSLGAASRYDNCHFSASGLVQHAALWKVSLGL